MRNILSARFYNALWMTSGIDVPAWVKHERLCMLERVNEERAKNDLPPITEKDIKKGEAVGDPNYGKRLADHCAGLCRK
jgi:hypothetical protein